jgi:DnaJ domain
MRDPYEVLGVLRSASAADITNAFRRLAREVHPDANKHDPNATSRFDDLNLAYEILGDENKRKAFDCGEIDAAGNRRSQGNEGFEDVVERDFTEVDDRPGNEFVRGDRFRGFGDSDDILKEAPGRGIGGAAHPELPSPDQGRARRWLALICLIAIGAGALIYFRGLNQPAQTLSRTERTCGTSGWRTSVTFDNSRPELVSTTLRSRDHIGSQDEGKCIDVVFACRSDGPYFEVRVDPSGPQINGMRLILVGSTSDELNASLSVSMSDDGRSIRVSDKIAVEVLVSVLMDRDSFAIRLSFIDGGNAVVRIVSFDLSTAIRPVLLA